VLICDGLVVIAFAYPEFITESNQYSAQIELNGLLTRGQLVVDRRQRADKKSERTINFITSFNESKLLDLMIKIIQ
jgi:inosine-uridine nucleoside N-ribohydrolase